MYEESREQDELLDVNKIVFVSIQIRGYRSLL